MLGATSGFHMGTIFAFTKRQAALLQKPGAGGSPSASASEAIDLSKGEAKKDPSDLTLPPI